MDAIPREKMGNATSLFNLMRNIGGSIGIAVDRHDARAPSAGDRRRMLGAQRHAPTTRRRSRCSRRCARRSWRPAPTPSPRRSRAYAALFGMVQRQATMVSFVGIFQLLGVVFFALIPLVLLMKRPKARPRPALASGCTERVRVVGARQRARRAFGRMLDRPSVLVRPCPSGAAARAARCVRSPDTAAATGSAISAPITPASCRADRERQNHRDVRQLQPVAVRPRRDHVVLDRGDTRRTEPATTIAAVGETVSAMRPRRCSRR